MNSIDISCKIKFMMSIANNNSVLELLDLSCVCQTYQNYHIYFTINLLSQNKHKQSFDEKFNIRSSKYQNFPISVIITLL